MTDTHDHEFLIEFQGKRYVLMGTLEEGGPITTPEQFKSFTASFAHLFPSGDIDRYGKKIGDVSEITVLGKTRLDDPSLGDVLGGLLDESWERR